MFRLNKIFFVTFAFVRRLRIRTVYGRSVGLGLGVLYVFFDKLYEIYSMVP